MMPLRLKSKMMSLRNGMGPHLGCHPGSDPDTHPNDQQEPNHLYPDQNKKPQDEDICF